MNFTSFAFVTEFKIMRAFSIMLSFIRFEVGSISAHLGIKNSIFIIGNSYKMLSSIRFISSLRSCSQLTGTTGVWYFSDICSANFTVSSLYGRSEFNTTTNGFPNVFNSVIVFSSAAR